ncbi:hypothetical protein GCM10025880_31950 [Methylorubrum aminovorans]|nr:hypothetical protein GCM10025880_31950 [Methylorubrum aminovorans]
MNNTGALGREAERLLAALAPEGAYAFPDPSAPETLIVRSGGRGVSLGAGRFSARAGETLLAADLASRDDGRRNRLVIGAAGRARLRRAEAGGADAFRMQHLAVVREGSGEAERLRDTAESPLAWMARRRGRDGEPMIDAAAFAAGSGCVTTSHRPRCCRNSRPTGPRRASTGAVRAIRLRHRIGSSPHGNGWISRWQRWVRTCQDC